MADKVEGITSTFLSLFGSFAIIISSMEPAISLTALFLVCVMTAVRDLEIARLLGWYRIPLRFAPKIIDVDYLAFYQTSAFGEAHRWKVEYYAQVRGHELTTRNELIRDEPDHPRANEEYYKVQIGPLVQAPKIIMAGNWKRFTFQYTTGEKFMRAATLKDLAANDSDREVIWKALRERAIHSGEYTSPELPEVPLDPNLLALLGCMQNNLPGVRKIADQLS